MAACAVTKSGHAVVSLACTTAFSVTQVDDWRWWPVGALVGLATCAGWLSPDADQSWLRGVPGGHRGMTHWPGWPILAAAVLLGCPGWVQVLGGYAVAGWASHLVGDVLIGERPMGIPLSPFGGWRVGLGALTPGTWLLRAGTRRESFMAVGFAGLVGWLLLSGRIGL